MERRTPSEVPLNPEDARTLETMTLETMTLETIPLETAPLETMTPREQSSGVLEPARALLVVPWVSMGLLLTGWLLFPATLTHFMYLPLLLSVVLLGLPHGALDHLVPTRMGWAWAQRLGPVLLYNLVYAGIAALLLLTWPTLPLLAFWSFLAVSLLHWGQGDLHFLEASLGRTRDGWWSAPLTTLARGSLPILVPLLVFPDWFQRLLLGATRIFDANAMPQALWSRVWPGWLLAILCLVLTGYAVDTFRSSPKPLLELGEVGLLLLLFTTVPPPLTIGSYFTLWHSWRHLGRLRALFHPTGMFHPAGGVQSAAGFGRFALLFVPITVLALLLLGGLYAWAALRIHDAERFAALYLALIAALTGPHALLVALMDFKRVKLVKVTQSAREVPTH